MKTEEISTEIAEMAKAWDKIQEDFIKAQKKLQDHLNKRGFDPITQEYNWIKNQGKMTKKEMVVLSHFGIVQHTMKALNDAQDRLGAAMKEKEWDSEEVINFINSLSAVVSKIRASFYEYPSIKKEEMRIFLKGSLVEA